MIVTVTLDGQEEGPIVADQGTIVVLQGTDEGGTLVRFGADHRMAQGILHGLEADGEVECLVEDWQVLG